MTDNNFIADQFSLLSKLMDIHGENSFKSRSYATAAFTIEKLPMQAADTDPQELARVRGIGDSAARKIAEILETGKMAQLEEILLQTPPGVLEMLQVKGIGPKKISTIWKEMEIESLGELLYACQENRLLHFKGFGEKTQRNIQEAIEYYMQNQGSFLYAEVSAFYPSILTYLQQQFSADAVAVTGDFRRQHPIIDALEFVVAQPIDKIKQAFQTAHPPQLLEETTDKLTYKLRNGLVLRLYSATTHFGARLLATTGPVSFTDKFHTLFPGAWATSAGTLTEEILFSTAGLPFIPPYLRDIDGVLARSTAHESVITEADIKGIIHTHSNWSDGSQTIEEMAETAIAKGFEYLVISDHSKSAFYANGLKEDRIREQHRQIDSLNAKYAPFRIFKSIECDILNDGNLDYSNDVLATFDLVIASVHSNLKMPEEKAMQRLLAAISNPYTTILGHVTGRLLLSRKGYPVDHKKIIAACAEAEVVIELNAHPRRLDMDWTWIPEAMDKGVLISIDPDAHATSGFDDCRFGVLAAQKGGLAAERNLSSFSLGRFEQFLLARKKTKGI